jgi:RNA recognition motif-containing protein
MTDKDLNDLFRPLRKISDVRVAIDRRTGQPRGFAHADFWDVEAAKAARDILEGKVVHGRELKTDYAISREKPAPRMTLQQLIATEQSKQEVEVDQETISDAVAEGVSVENLEGGAIDAEVAMEEKSQSA